MATLASEAVAMNRMEKCNDQVLSSKRGRLYQYLKRGAQNCNWPKLKGERAVSDSVTSSTEHQR